MIFLQIQKKLQKNKNLALQYGISNNEKSFWGLTDLSLPEKLSLDKELLFEIAKGNKTRNLKFDDTLINHTLMLNLFSKRLYYSFLKF